MWGRAYKSLVLKSGRRGSNPRRPAHHTKGPLDRRAADDSSGSCEESALSVHVFVYTARVKRRELEKVLRELGWRFLRRGGKHDLWTDGDRQEPIPRHAEINEQLARAILRRARKDSKA